jgi:hypothetical protein
VAISFRAQLLRHFFDIRPQRLYTPNGNITSIRRLTAWFWNAHITQATITLNADLDSETPKAFYSGPITSTSNLVSTGGVSA